MATNTAVTNNNALSVKWLHRGEFYRFSLVDVDQEELFAALMAKTRTLQPNFNGSLVWKDEFGDMINLTSGVELTEAINAKVIDEPLCVYTKIDGLDPNGFSAPPPPYSLVCETVDNSQKCSVCQKEISAAISGRELIICESEACNFNICKDCHADGTHRHEHPLHRVTFNEARDILSIESSAACDICGETIHGVLYNCAECIDFDLCQKCMEEEGENHDKEHVIDCYAFTELVELPYKHVTENDTLINQLNGKVARPKPTSSVEAKAWIGCLVEQAEEQQKQQGEKKNSLLTRIKKRISKTIQANSSESSRSVFYI